MKQEQLKFLKQRLEEANRMQMYAYKSEPTPAWYREAERRMSAWRQAQDRQRRKHRKAVERRYVVAKTALLFADAGKALAAVEKFEAGK